MSENVQPNFAPLDDDDLDIEAIFGGKPTGIEEASFPLPEPESPQPTDIAPLHYTNAAEEDDDSVPPAEVLQPFTGESGDGMDLFTALESEKPSQMQVQETAPKNMSLFDKPPYFNYGNAMEAIVDDSLTFEELRINKSDDFPELSEGKKVTWYVKYGKVTKYISDPKGTTIVKIKEEIEESKQFLDGIKKPQKRTTKTLIASLSRKYLHRARA